MESSPAARLTRGITPDTVAAVSNCSRSRRRKRIASPSRISLHRSQAAQGSHLLADITRSCEFFVIENRLCDTAIAGIGRVLTWRADIRLEKQRCSSGPLSLRGEQLDEVGSSFASKIRGLFPDARGCAPICAGGGRQARSHTADCD